jgi:hypothetical protein
MHICHSVLPHQVVILWLHSSVEGGAVGRLGRCRIYVAEFVEVTSILQVGGCIRTSNGRPCVWDMCTDRQAAQERRSTPLETNTYSRCTGGRRTKLETGRRKLVLFWLQVAAIVRGSSNSVAKMLACLKVGLLVGFSQECLGPVGDQWPKAHTCLLYAVEKATALRRPERNRGLTCGTATSGTRYMKGVHCHRRCFHVALVPARQ